MDFVPVDIFQQLEEAADRRASAEENAHRLEKLGEVLLGSLIARERRHGTPATLCKDIARTREEWATHIEGEAVAIGERSRARAAYENVKILAEGLKTAEVSRRQLAG